jgi:hypothetical protein
MIQPRSSAFTCVVIVVARGPPDVARMWIALAFVALAVVHLLAAGPIVAPGALVRLYGVSADDATLMALLRHRAVLLALVGVLCLWASVAADVRPAALVAAAINILAFLAMYALHGAPAGPLWTVALVDAAALAPLAVAIWGVLGKP